MTDNHNDNTIITAPPDVIFLPDWRSGNPYQDLLAAGIRSTGYTVDFADYPESELPLLTLLRSYPTVRVIHLHWIHSYAGRILWSGNRLKAWLRALFLVYDIFMVRRRGVKVIWTVHNRLAHESAHPQREIMARRILARIVTRLIFHSAEARVTVEQLLGIPLKHRSSIIPHGNYLGIYPANPTREQQLRDQFNLRDHHTVILFFGALRRYKGIDQLLQAFRVTPDPNLRLIIAGKPFEPIIRAEIKKAVAEDSRIHACLDFIPETDVNPLYAIAHLAAVPFERTLTSGSAILALSMGKALLLPDEARVLGLPTEGTLYFGKEQGLKETLQRLSTWDLNAMGQINSEAAQALNWTRIGAMTMAAYGFLPTDLGAEY